MPKPNGPSEKTSLHTNIGNIELQKVNVEDFKQNWDLLQINHGPHGNEISENFLEHMCASMGQTGDVVEELGEVCRYIFSLV